MAGYSKLDKVGDCVLLLIGVCEYPQWSSLDTLESPSEDVPYIRDYFVDEFFIDKVIEIPSHEATSIEIGNVLADLEKELTPADSLIIYFSGHGKKKGKGKAEASFWLGKDAIEDNLNSWITHNNLKTQLSDIKARHTLVISDACYSGFMKTKAAGSSKADTNILKTKYETKSRWILTSGGDAPVDDKHPESQYSIFASCLVETLKLNSDKPYILISDIINTLKNSVLEISNGRQEPQYFQLSSALDDGKVFGGETVLFRRNVKPVFNTPSIETFDFVIKHYTRSFYGRGFVFEYISNFLEDDSIPNGYLWLTADPGFGKTAISAMLTQTLADAWHFLGVSEDLDNRQCLRQNLVHQLFERFQFSEEDIEKVRNSEDQLLTVLNEISFSNERCVIVIDGLDEIENGNLITPYFPRELPENIYFVMTSRREDNFKLPRTFVKHEILHTDPNNERDIDSFLDMSLQANISFEAFAQKNGLSVEELKQILLNKSEGNFMYLTQVLPALTGNSTFYSISNLDEIPHGLTNYYHDHWKRMKLALNSEWEDKVLPIVVALTVSIKSKSIEELMRESRVNDRHFVRKILQAWTGVLHEIIDRESGNPVKLYRLYHASFRDFLYALDEVEDERILLASRRGQIGQDQARMLQHFFSENE